MYCVILAQCDRICNVAARRYEFDEDRDQKVAESERTSLRLALRDIAARINQTLRLVDKLSPRLRDHIRNAIGSSCRALFVLLPVNNV